MKLAKPLLAVLVAGVVYLALAHFNLVPSAIVQKAEVPKEVSLPSADTTPAVHDDSVQLVGLPSTTPAAAKGPQMRLNAWAWNAQMGLFYANGGPLTTAGSLMEKHGVRLLINRQDDTEKSKPEQIKFAQELSTTSNPSDGINFVIIMGDGAAQYLAAVNKALVKLGPDYRAEVVGAVGYSRGEDAFMGPEAWKESPEAMKGGLVAGVLRDGDWNIAMSLLGNNGIKNNPDERTWDPDALNWVAADDYLKAADMYIAGYCEDRDVVKDGRKTGEKHHGCVDGVVTWTPGDVNVAKKKGGLVKLLSTKENVYQMPAVVIGIHKWDVTHAKQVQEMLAAAFEGADQIRNFDAALQRAGKASFAIYKEESPSYWVKYYKGGIESDKKGLPLFLGGSLAMNFADNALLFGLAEGSGSSSSLFKATYEGFGNIAAQQYPKLVPSFPKTAEAVNLTFLSALAATMNAKNADTPEFDAGPIAKENVVAARNVSIQFETGKATFTPAAEATLTDLYTKLVVGGALSVEIDGYTDNVGVPAANLDLSQRRAAAVKTWLTTKAPTLFPDARVSVQGHGDAEPVASNATADGRAANRRVKIVLGSKG